MLTICLKKKKNNPSQSKILATLEDIHMGRSGRSNKQVYMFCIDIDPVGESNKWASYLNFACSFSACSYYWIYFIELPTMLLTFWQDGLYIISLCQRYCAELLISFLCTYCLVFVFFDKDFLLSKKKKKKNTKTNKEHLWHWFCSGSSSICLVQSRRFSFKKILIAWLNYMFFIQVQRLIISPRYWCGEVSHPSIEILLMMRKGKYIINKLAQGSKGVF